MAKNVQREPGRPSEHEAPLPQATKNATYACLRYLREEESLSDREIATLLCEFGQSHDCKIPVDSMFSELMENDFYPEPATIGRVFGRGRFTDSGLVKAFFLLFSIKYSDIWTERHRDEELRLNEPFVRAAHILLGYTEVISVDVAKALNGHFKLYRPFHLFPSDQISVCAFVIGSEESIYDCEFVTEFDDEGKHKRHVSRGKIIPHGKERGRLTAITSGDEKTVRSSFMFHFDDIEVEGVALALAGSLVASWGNHQSSAWPVYAVRLEEGEEFVPHVISREQFSTLPRGARHRLNCGAVYWQEPFPRPFDGT